MIAPLTLTALITVAFSDPPVSTAVAEKTTITVRADEPGKPISRDLFGIFFEDINDAADGGLYAELVQNRSFEYSPKTRRGWRTLTAWEFVERDGGKGTITVEQEAPIHVNNPHYAMLTIQSDGDRVGLRNEGFGGIAVKAGEEYTVSLFSRQLDGAAGPIKVRLEKRDGGLLAEAELEKPSGEWKRSAAALRPTAACDDARLVVLATSPGRLALDMVSLFPRATFHNRPNGLRADLATTIAELKPRFVRFPGGCLVHGDGLDNMYRWKDTVGPVERRRGQRNLWGYDQTVGLGFFEFFQFCEDIGARPLPVLPSGVCCQFRRTRPDGTRTAGQLGVPESEMPAQVQDVLDLIEFANGPVGTPWGAMRAAAGHPAPFNLQYLAIGNEEQITPVFEQRFRMIHDAVKRRHPEITLIGTAGPGPGGKDFDAGWKLADALRLPIIDEHYYEKPEWFLGHLGRYDKYDRNRSKVYLGEYAAHERNRRSTLRSALAEAAYMTSLERNGDLVRMASYAPLLGKIGHTQWNPNLIYFTNTAIRPTINYYVQQLFGRNVGDVYLANTVDTDEWATGLTASSVRESRTGHIILKLVNNGDSARPLHIELAGVKSLGPSATATVLTGDPKAVNSPDGSTRIEPRNATIPVAASFDYELPAHALAVIRVESR